MLVIERFEKISQKVLFERAKQDRLKKEGRFRHTLDDNPGYTDEEKLIALLEEVTEVGKAIMGEKGHIQDGGDIDKELIQVAALAFAWLEGRLVDG